MGKRKTKTTGTKQTLRLPCIGITLRLWPPADPRKPASGTITSDLRQDGPEDPLFTAAIDGLEALVLAHACAGVDVASPAYIEGIEMAVEAISNHLL